MRSSVVALLALTAVAMAACGSSARDPFAGSLDHATDAGVLDASLDTGSAADANVPEGDGALLGAPCTDNPQCNDGVACTYDSCDPLTLRCLNVPDDTQCDDGLYCDGQEVCVAFHGCASGPVVTCDDGDVCTIDACVEATKTCTHAIRDQDQDGDPDAHCDPGHDCNDLDPAVASTLPEICANLIDDNCNGVVDEAPCTTPADGTCATALAITAPGTYALDTLGSGFLYPTTCDVPTPSSAHQAVALITVPAGGAQDVDVWATAKTSAVAVALQSVCGDAKSELSCGGGATNLGRARGRSLAPGTYAAIVTTQTEDTVDLAVDFLAPTTPPTNESCAAPLPITPGTPIDVSLIDSSLNLASQCVAELGELTYALTLTEAQDVRVYASVTRGNGEPVLGIRDAACAAASDEITCRASAISPLFARNLAAGTYVITVAATATIDASIVVRTTSPTPAPAGQTCATAPVMPVNAVVAVDLSNSTYAIDDGCFPGYPDAAFDLPLAAASDVLLVARFSETEAGAVSLDTPTCSLTAMLECTASGTPARTTKRNVPPGDYRVVVADVDGAQDNSVTAYVRNTVPPTAITGADDCAHIVTLPTTGGFFTGDTTNATPDFDDSCDASGQPAGGAPDQILSLTLAQPQHVVLDMNNSAFATILDVRQGATCPGTEVPNDCYTGFSAQRSFLDLELAAGDYWIVIDGYAGSKGAWDLDVRVLPP